VVGGNVATTTDKCGQNPRYWIHCSTIQLRVW